MMKSTMRMIKIQPSGAKEAAKKEGQADNRQNLNIILQLSHLDHHLDHHVDHQGGEDAEDDEGAEDQPRAVPVEDSLHLHPAPHSFALDFPISSASISHV